MSEAERRIEAALNAISIHESSQSDEMGTDAEHTISIVEGFLRGEIPLNDAESEVVRLTNALQRIADEADYEWRSYATSVLDRSQQA